jgi:hypothetical protein
MGLEFKMNTAFWPQTDGQTERVNLVIQQFLRNYVATDQQDWVDLGTFYNGVHPLSNGDGQVTNCAHYVGDTWKTPKWCKWGSANGHTIWWREVALVGGGKGQLGKGAQAVQGLCRQVLTRGEVSRRGWSVVEHQELLIAKRFKSQVLRPICGPIQSVRKDTFLHLQVRITKKS